MDLETRTIDGLMLSYCVSIYEGKTFKSFYLSDHSPAAPAQEINAEKDMEKQIKLLKNIMEI
jgi:hypothetical protein